MGPFAELSTLQAAAPPVLLALNVGLGLMGGYIVGRRRAASAAHDQRSIDDDAQRSNEASLERLEALATHMTDRVAHHNERVEAINLTLNNDSQQAAASPQVVAQAATNLLDANGRLQAELKEARQALAEQSEKLHAQRREAMTDPLTGLPNRRAFDQELQAQLSHASGSRPFDLLMMIDIDHFKQVNDRFGHLQGDLVLERVASVLREIANTFDGFAARYGGEEFTLLLPAMEENETTECSERLRRAVEALRIECQGERVPVTISVGCARIELGDTREGVVSRADAALYAAKRAGRNRVVHHKNHTCMPPAHDDEPLAKPAETLAPEKRSETSPPGKDRRQYAARAFTGMHWIAPHIDGQFPSEDEFMSVQGIDVSAGGLSFSSDCRPSCESFVVRFNVSGEIRYLKARVTNCGPLADKPGQFRVGCQFLGRLEPGGEHRPSTCVADDDLAALSQPHPPAKAVM